MSGLKNQLTKRTTRWIIGAIAVVVAAVAIVGYGVWANQSVVERQFIHEAEFPIYAPICLR